MTLIRITMHSLAPVALALAACGANHSPAATDGSGSSHLPLVKVSDIAIPGAANRFDYQEIDKTDNLLVVAHMNDSSVVIFDLADGSVKKVLSNIPTPRGVAIADDAGRIFVTSSPSHLVVIDAHTLNEISRVTTGTAPDGDAWDPDDQIVGVSDQGDGALSLIADVGSGTRRAVALGSETGNVVYDTRRKQFWITVVGGSTADELVEVDPRAGTVTTRIPLPGCQGAHGLRLHPDGNSAFIACEDNDMMARVELGDTHTLATGKTGAGPDVMSIDAGLGWLYVAAESGDLTIFDINAAGVSLVGHDHPGAGSHTVAVDPATHRAFFPLTAGPDGTPVLRIMRPAAL